MSWLDKVIDEMKEVKCVLCGSEVVTTGFRDIESRNEWDISQMCQSCQDGIWGKVKKGCECKKWSNDCIACERVCTTRGGDFWDGGLACQKMCDGDGSCPNCEKCEKRKTFWEKYTNRRINDELEEKKKN